MAVVIDENTSWEVMDSPTDESACMEVLPREIDDPRTREMKAREMEGQKEGAVLMVTLDVR